MNNNLQDVVDQIDVLMRQEKPQFVVAGTETGIELADQLASHWQLPGNNPLLSFARRDKYEMALQLKNQHLSAPVSFCSSSLPEV